MSIQDRAQALRASDQTILDAQPESVKSAFARELKAQSMAAEIRDRLRSIPDHATALEAARTYVYDDAAANIAINKSPTQGPVA